MYYNPLRQPHLQLKSKVYIAKYIETIQDEDLNQKQVYEKPVKYFFNVQPVNQESEIREFGEMVEKMKVALITEKVKYANKFKEFDLVYLDGAEPTNEVDYGDKANYRIYAIRSQNTIIRIYFVKRTENQ